MTIEQGENFKQRCELVAEKHRKQDPKLKKARRKSALYLMSLPIYAGLAAGVMLLGVKSVSLALNSPAGYLAMVDPVLAGAPTGSLRETLFAPDPVSREIAAMLRPILRPAASPAEGPPSPPLANAPAQPD